MKATDFTRDDCVLGNNRVSYATLKREYRCSACGGRIIVVWVPLDDLAGEGWYVRCGRCNEYDFIHENEFRREQTDAREVLDDLPPDLAAALKGETDDSCRCYH